MPEALPLSRACAAPGCRPPRDRRLTLHLLAALPLLAAGLRVLGFRRTYALLGRMSRRRPARHGAGRRATTGRGYRSPDHTAALVVHVNRHLLPYQSRCLLESLALWYLLRRRGHAAELLLGARTLLGPFEAHAWVELDGVALNDDDNVRDVYQAFGLPAVPPATGTP